MTVLTVVHAGLARTLSVLTNSNTHPVAQPAGGSCTSKYQVSLNLLDGATAPGIPSLQHIIDMLGVIVVLSCLLAAIGGVGVVNFGGVIGIRHAGQLGRMMIIGGVIGAFAIGLLVVLINWALSLGLNTHC